MPDLRDPSAELSSTHLLHGYKSQLDDVHVSIRIGIDPAVLGRLNKPFGGELSRHYYEHARARGQSHTLAIRNLASKWVKIIFRMWKERKLYNEERHVLALIRRGGPIAEKLR